MIGMICSRRSIRSFAEEQVTQEELYQILKAGSYAPSGSNSQSWRFTALQDQKLLRALNDEVKSAFLRTEYDEKEYPAKRAAKISSAKEDYVFFYNAPMLIIVSNVSDYTNAVADSAAAIQNMLLGAHALGLGACWINQLTWVGEDERITSFLHGSLELPQNHVVCGSLAVGRIKGNYPKAAPRAEGVYRIFQGGDQG